MSGAQFIRKVEDLGRRQGLVVEFIPRRGKGSHGTLFYGKRHAIVGNLKKELKTGTFHGILSQLGIKSNEFWGGAQNIDGRFSISSDFRAG